MYCKWNVTFYSSHQQTYFWQSPHGPSSECPFMSILLQLWRFHLTLTSAPKCSQVLGCLENSPSCRTVARGMTHDLKDVMLIWSDQFQHEEVWSCFGCKGCHTFPKKNRNCVWIRKPDWLLSLQMLLWRKLGCWQSCQCLRPTWHRTWRGMHLHSRT